MQTDPRVDAYIAGAAPFARPLLTWLRERVGVACPQAQETIKWGRPFFTVNGRPLANMAAFTAHASFRLWKAADDGDGDVLARLQRITAVGDLPDGTVLEQLIRAASVRTERRPTSRPAKQSAATPEALTGALASDADASAAWDRLPPGARREYEAWIAAAKRADTRDRRVATTLAQVREGKKLNWQYESR